MNVLITVNRRYIGPFTAMLRSLEKNTPDNFTVYLISKDLTQEDVEGIKSNLYDKEKFNFVFITVDKEFMRGAPVSKKYPDTIYYRLFAGELLPKDVDRVLYLDTDLIVIKDISNLYNSDFNGKIFLGATHTGSFLRKFNEIKNNASKGAPYINTGVLLINLQELRKVHDGEKIYGYIRDNYYSLALPDQDILQGLYGDKIGLFDTYKYNLADRLITFYNLRHKDKIDEEWVENNCHIVHYFGKNKPWRNGYKGILDKYFFMYSDGLDTKGA